MCGIMGSMPVAGLDPLFLAHRGPDGRGSSAVGDDVTWPTRGWPSWT